MAAGDDGSITLVFNRAALERLADPASVFADARTWTAVLGLVSDRAPERLPAYAERTGIDPDVLSREGGQTGGLAAVRQQFPTDRHVFVGMTDEDRRTAESLGWEYLSVGEAAEAADWSLAERGGRWRILDEE